MVVKTLDAVRVVVGDIVRFRSNSLSDSGSGLWAQHSSLEIFNVAQKSRITEVRTLPQRLMLCPKPSICTHITYLRIRESQRLIQDIGTDVR